MSSCGFNLIRNARMFFTTNVNTETGVVKATGFTTTNTKEIQVLDGLSFSQNTTAETVTINEAGDSPTRGQRNFNTALEPVELSFSTYLRPFFAENTGTNAYDSTDTVEAEEDVLWNAFATGDNGVVVDQTIGADQAPGAARPGTGTAGAAAAWRKFNGTGAVEPYSQLGYDMSGKNQLQKFGVIIVLDSTSYIIDNCVLDQASIDFGIDAIATIAWTARGSVIRAADVYATEGATVSFYGSYIEKDAGSTTNTGNTGVASAATDTITQAGHGLKKGQKITVTAGTTIGGVATGDILYVLSTTNNTFTVSSTLANYTAGTAVNLTAGAGTVFEYDSEDYNSAAKGKNTTAPFLANKLSVVDVLAEGINGAGTSYTLALTGGNITLSNNVTYLTPANLGVVNKPFTYFTGTRAVSGSLNCYLKTGSTNSGKLLEDLIAASATNVDPAYNLKISIGAPNTSGKTRVLLHMPATVLTIPTINTEQVVSTTVNFTAQGYNSSDEFDICANNEISIRYYSANTTA